MHCCHKECSSVCLITYCLILLKAMPLSKAVDMPTSCNAQLLLCAYGKYGLRPRRHILQRTSGIVKNTLYCTYYTLSFSSPFCTRKRLELVRCIALFIWRSWKMSLLSIIEMNNRSFSTTYRVEQQTLPVKFFLNFYRMLQDMNLKISTDNSLVLSYDMNKAWNTDSALVSVMTKVTIFFN